MQIQHSTLPCAVFATQPTPHTVFPYITRNGALTYT